MYFKKYVMSMHRRYQIFIVKYQPAGRNSLITAAKACSDPVL
jgi:hypothetical protein